MNKLLLGFALGILLMLCTASIMQQITWTEEKLKVLYVDGIRNGFNMTDMLWDKNYREAEESEQKRLVWEYINTGYMTSLNKIKERENELQGDKK